jgi:A/G-specific adenine glycosylase
MELGALICKPINPYCEQCPISEKCKSYKKKDFVLNKLKKITKRNIIYLMFIKKRKNTY